MKTLFWNVNRRNLQTEICEIANTHDIDAIAVVESDLPLNDMCKELRKRVNRNFFIPRAELGRVQLFSRLKEHDLSEVHAEKRMSIRRLVIGSSFINLCIVHLVDKFNWDEQNQLALTTLLSKKIREFEAEHDNSSTIVLGDFNMNPFDPPMRVVSCLNAMMTRECVRKEARIQQGESFPYFYNPMWGHFGDRSKGPAGTFYHTSSSHGTSGWNMIDQVLLRPKALPSFVDVEILTSTGTNKLTLSNGRPDALGGSDHLPILLSLKDS